MKNLEKCIFCHRERDDFPKKGITGQGCFHNSLFISFSIILSLASLNLLPEKTKNDIPWKNRPIPHPKRGHSNQRV